MTAGSPKWGCLFKAGLKAGVEQECATGFGGKEAESEGSGPEVKTC